MTSDNTSILPVLQGAHEPLADLMDHNFLNYASYVICERAIPNLRDGLKPVQRRILHSLREKYDRRFIKAANVIGHAMQYHPHGDASIADALVNLANKEYLIEKQGNYGNILTGDPAAAPRYIECRLAPLALEELFHDELTTYIDSYDGRNREPVELPCKLPLLLMLGAEGIAVGMATKILPHNFKELLEAQIAILQGKKFQLLPDFQQGGLMDPRNYDNGNGMVKARARIEIRDTNKLYITELPFGTTTESLIDSIEQAIKFHKLPIASIFNYTAEKVEIELLLKPETNSEKIIRKLYAFTNCEISINSHIIVLKDKRPVKMTVPEILKYNTDCLLDILKAELDLQKNHLLTELHNRTLQRIFIEEQIYQHIEKCSSVESIKDAILTGFAPFTAELLQAVSNADIETLLSIRIRQISDYDREKNRKQTDSIRAEITEIEKRISNMKNHALRKLRGLLKKYGHLYPRKTEITSFTEVHKRELTADELTIAYCPDSGFLGQKIDNITTAMTCSPYDRLLLIWADGSCKVIRPTDKMFANTHLMYMGKIDGKRVMTIVYTEEGFTYLKRFRFSGTSTDKLYRCGRKGAKVLFVCEGTPEKLYVKYKPYEGMQIPQQFFTPRDTSVRKLQSDGSIMTSKEIDTIAAEPPPWWDLSIETPKGKFMNF